MTFIHHYVKKLWPQGWLIVTHSYPESCRSGPTGGGVQRPAAEHLEVCFISEAQRLKGSVGPEALRPETSPAVMMSKLTGRETGKNKHHLTGRVLTLSTKVLNGRQTGRSSKRDRQLESSEMLYPSLCEDSTSVWTDVHVLINSLQVYQLIDYKGNSTA